MPETVATLASVHLRNERSIWIRPPRNPVTARCLTLILDAELYREKVAACEAIDGLGKGAADSWFVFVSTHSVEARWLECPCHPPFAAFIVDELLPWLAARHPEIGAVERRVIVGLSYTGLAAAYIAIERPGVFQRVISQSGSFWWNDCHLVKRMHETPRLPTAFYLDVGTRETQTNVQHRPEVLQVVAQIDGVRRFRDQLLAKGHAVKYVEFPGAHDCREWKLTLPGALAWALGA